MSICHLCLRTDRKVHIVDDMLGDMLDDLCDFATVELTESCAECAWTLKKFYDFRDKCILAVTIFEKWKKQKDVDKIPMNLLYKELPQSGLGFSNIQNCKVFTYNEIEKTNPINPSNPCIVIDPSKLGICSNNLKNDTDIFDDEVLENAVTSYINTIDEIKNEIVQYDSIDEIKCESDEISEDNETAQISKEFDMVVKDCDSEVKDESTDAEYLNLELLDDAEYLDTNLLEDANVTINKEDCNITNNDTTEPIQTLNNFEEVIIEENYKETKKRSKTVKNGNKMKCIKQIKKIVDRKAIEIKKARVELYRKMRKLKFEKLECPMLQSKIELLRDMLKDKFDNNDELTDEKGNVIDEKVILDCLDKLPLQVLREIARRFKGSKTFNSGDINLFAKLQRRYKTEYESVFTTKTLVTDKQILEEFSKRQYDESYIASEHKCTTCYKGFKFAKLLNYHLQTHHDTTAPFECPLCKMRYRTKKGLHRHKNSSHKNILKCILCPFASSYRTSMVNHFHFHKGVTYTCNICPRTYISITALKMHNQLRHSSDIFCASCGRGFVSAAGLNYHRMLKHRDEVTDPADSVKCQTCGVTFVSKTVLELHERRTHRRSTRSTLGSTTGWRTRKCNANAPSTGPSTSCATGPATSRTPGRATSRSTGRASMRSTGRATGHATGRAIGLATGIGSGCGPKKFVCRLCQNVGPSVGWLNKHFRYEHPNISLEEAYWMGKKYLCHVCGKTFGNVTQLNDHKLLHSGAKPYSCSQCSRSYHCKNALRRHLLVHLPKMRQCEVCGKKFRSLSNFNNHKRIHSSNERIYKCESCSAEFLFRSALKEHVLGVHQNVRRVRVRPGKRKIQLETTRVTETEDIVQTEE